MGGLDPRTKLALLFTVTTLMFSTSNQGAMLVVKLVLALVPFVLLASAGRWPTAAKYLLLYAACFLLERAAFVWLQGLASFAALSLASIMTRFAPGIMVGAWFVATTSVSDFLTAMRRLYVSEQVLIPFSVIFRFFPTIAEEYHAISDAMRLRGVRLGGGKMTKLFEYRVVPLIVSVVRVGDELSAAALCRGLGAPVQRTVRGRVRLRAQDALVLGGCVACYAVFVVSHFGA